MFGSVRCVTLLRPLGARLGHRIRGKPPGKARTVAQRLEEVNRGDPFYEHTFDIGLPSPKVSRSRELYARLAHLRERKTDSDLERTARENRLLVDLDAVDEEWMRVNGPLQVRTAAKHYGVFRHLYGEGYFVPRVRLDVAYPRDDDLAVPVHHGNVVKPAEAREAPDVRYSVEPDSLWTLLLTNLDGHLTEPDSEYVHWCVANVPQDRIHQGQTLVQYVRPFPPKGTGFHRYVFVLYKQETEIDYNFKTITDESPLRDRTFKTRDWYAEHQDVITPAGLAFFQTDWDPTVTDFYHETLNMREPRYEYDFPKPYLRPQERFPVKMPFNVYMDKYRDPEDLNREYFLRTLKTVHPFKKPEPPLRYPHAQKWPRGVPSWLQLKEKNIRLGWGRINQVK